MPRRRRPRLNPELPSLEPRGKHADADLGDIPIRAGGDVSEADEITKLRAMLDDPAMPESLKAKVRTLLRQAQEHEQLNQRMRELRCSFCGEGFNNPVVRSLIH